MKQIFEFGLNLLSQKQKFYLIWGFTFSICGALPGKDPGKLPSHSATTSKLLIVNTEVILGILIVSVKKPLGPIAVCVLVPQCSMCTHNSERSRGSYSGPFERIYMASLIFQKVAF